MKNAIATRLKEAIRAYKTRRTYKGSQQMKRESSLKGIAFGRSFVWRSKP